MEGATSLGECILGQEIDQLMAFVLKLYGETCE